MYPNHTSGYTARCGEYDDEREENFKKQERSHKQPSMTIIQLAQYKKRHGGEKIIQSDCKQDRIIIRR
jgi:hypothetical protein